MAKTVLPTNFKDDILNAGMNGKRRYRETTNSDGTVSLEDASVYDQVGSNFGAGQINATNTAVNESADKNTIIDNIDDIAANTKSGMIAGALALKEVNQNLGGFTPIIDDTGKITGYKTQAGADTVFPFKSGKTILVASGLKIALSPTTYTYNIKILTNNWESLTIDNFYGIPWVRGQEVINTGSTAFPGRMLSYNATTGILTHTTYRKEFQHSNIETGYTDIYLIDCVLD